MNFDGYVKKIGSVDMSVIEHIATIGSVMDWNTISYERHEEKLIHSRLLEFPYNIVRNKEYSLEQTNFINNCSVLIELISTFFPNFVKVRGEVAILYPGGELEWHSDDHWFQKFSHRIHIPIITSNECVQLWDNHAEHLSVGNIYEINNRKVHSARNSGSGARIHIILDFCDSNIWYPFVNNGGQPLLLVKP